MEEKENRPLTPKEKKFVEKYLLHLNASKAAEESGYSKKTCGQIGYQLLQRSSIQRAIQEAMERRAKRTEITADKVLKELARIAFSDISDYVTFEDGAVIIRDSSELTEDQTRCIAEVSDSTYKDERKRSFKLHDKVKAIDMALRHLGLYLDKSEVKLQGKLSFDEIIDLAEKKDGHDGQNQD